MTIESPTDGDVFLAFLEHVLGPRLEPGHIVVLDNLGAHTRFAAVNDELRTRLRELAEQRRRWGYRRLHILLKREGWKVNSKRVYRIYVEEKLVVRRRRRRRRICAQARVLLAPPSRPNETWTMDFLHDALASGRKFRTLSIEDAYTREMLTIEVDTSLPSLRVVRVLERLRLQRGLPERIVIDHGTEFTSKALDRWAYENTVTLHFITPGRPMENGCIESFHGRFREECLNEHWFLTLDEARETIEEWRLDYNRVRPHSSLGYLTPEEFCMGYANVESKNSFPHSHSPDGGRVIPLLNSTPSALTYPD
jgi:putative transposase